MSIVADIQLSYTHSFDSNDLLGNSNCLGIHASWFLHDHCIVLSLFYWLYRAATFHCRTIMPFSCLIVRNILWHCVLVPRLLWQINITYIHIPRIYNHVADSYANYVLDWHLLHKYTCKYNKPITISFSFQNIVQNVVIVQNFMVQNWG